MTILFHFGEAGLIIIIITIIIIFFIFFLGGGGAIMPRVRVCVCVTLSTIERFHPK